MVGRVAGTGAMEMYAEAEKREPTQGRGKMQMINEDDGEKRQGAEESCVDKATGALVQIYLVKTRMISST